MKLRVIYEPRGRAREYSQLAVNLYSGCAMGCDYCYVPSILRKDKVDFHKSSEYRKDILTKLEKDLQDLQKAGLSKKLVMFSFTSDVYQLNEDFNTLTREALKLFNKYNQSFHILTKGGLKAVRDFDLYKKTDWFASSLTFFDKEKSLEIEPLADIPKARIEALKIAKEKGIKTWVSFEPVLDANETLKLYEATKDFVDFYKVGKISRYKVDVDWGSFANEIVKRLEKDKKPFFIKHDLRPHLQKDVNEYKYHREVE
jgi:DNA repair photolyase